MSRRWSWSVGTAWSHVAVQALADSETQLGLIPAGTGNDVARYFDVPRDDTAAATDVVIGGLASAAVDLARIGSTYFVTVLAAGFDASSTSGQRHAWPKGRIRYNLATVAELRTFKPIPYVVDLDGSRRASRPRSSQSATDLRSAAGCGSPRAPCSTTACWTSVVSGPIGGAGW